MQALSLFNRRTGKRAIAIAKWFVLGLGLFSLGSTANAASEYEYAQNTYSRGQHLDVAYEGWRQNEDGTYSLTFGYFNHNWEEELDIPVGENNRFYPGEADRGQPTHFLPRRNRFTFDVVVPADFGDSELAWTVTAPNGKTRTAYGTLRQDYMIDNVIIMSETGALGAGTSSPELRANIPPNAELMGDEIRTVRVGEPLTLQTRLSDDGVPEPFDPAKRTKRFLDRGAAEGREGVDAEIENFEALRTAVLNLPPSGSTVRKNNGLYLAWNVYRAPETMTRVQEKVHFSPDQVKPWEDTRTSANSPWGWFWVPPELPEDGVVDTTVTFDEPGTYLLWGRADDGGLYSDLYVTVNVSP